MHRSVARAFSDGQPEWGQIWGKFENKRKMMETWGKIRKIELLANWNYEDGYTPDLVVASLVLPHMRPSQPVGGILLCTSREHNSVINLYLVCVYWPCFGAYCMIIFWICNTYPIISVFMWYLTNLTYLHTIVLNLDLCLVCKCLINYSNETVWYEYILYVCLFFLGQYVLISERRDF